MQLYSPMSALLLVILGILLPIVAYTLYYVTFTAFTILVLFIIIQNNRFMVKNCSCVAKAHLFVMDIS